VTPAAASRDSEVVGTVGYRLKHARACVKGGYGLLLVGGDDGAHERARHLVEELRA
jgi:hypothetical protein